MRGSSRRPASPQTPIVGSPFRRSSGTSLLAVEGRGEVDEVRLGPLGSGYRDVLVPGRAVCRFWQAPREKPLELPPLVPPEGDGYMPLYCAAQWIASKGGTVIFDPEDEANWRPTYAALVDAIASDRVRVVGTRNGTRERFPDLISPDARSTIPLPARRWK